MANFWTKEEALLYTSIKSLINDELDEDLNRFMYLKKLNFAHSEFRQKLIVIKNVYGDPIDITELENFKTTRCGEDKDWAINYELLLDDYTIGFVTNMHIDDYPKPVGQYTLTKIEDAPRFDCYGYISPF